MKHTNDNAPNEAASLVEEVNRILDNCDKKKPNSVCCSMMHGESCPILISLLRSHANIRQA